MSSLELTGERTLPGIERENYWFQRHLAAYRFAASLVRGTVADVGSGEGYGAALLAGATCALGLDVDPDAVGHAARAYPAVRFVRADARRLPFRGASIDGIVALQVIEHLDDSTAFLEDARRVLRSGGLLVLSTPNRATFPAGINPWHTHEYEAEELHAVVGRRFDAVSILAVRHGPLLTLVDRALGEPVGHRLTRTAWEELPPGVRAMLGRVRPGAFRMTAEPRTGLDLVVVARA